MWERIYAVEDELMEALLIIPYFILFLFLGMMYLLFIGGAFILFCVVIPFLVISSGYNIVKKWVCGLIKEKN